MKDVRAAVVEIVIAIVVVADAAVQVVVQAAVREVTVVATLAAEDAEDGSAPSESLRIGWFLIIVRAGRSDAALFIGDYPAASCECDLYQGMPSGIPHAIQTRLGPLWVVSVIAVFQQLRSTPKYRAHGYRRE